MSGVTQPTASVSNAPLLSTQGEKLDDQLEKVRESLTQKLDAYIETREESERINTRAFSVIKLMVSKANETIKNSDTPLETKAVVDKIFNDAIAVINERLGAENNENTSSSSQQSPSFLG